MRPSSFYHDIIVVKYNLKAGCSNEERTLLLSLTIDLLMPAFWAHEEHVAPSTRQICRNASHYNSQCLG